MKDDTTCNYFKKMKIYLSLIDRLKTQHHSIETILSAIDENRMKIRPHPDKWNIHDNIAHLAKYQLVFIDRLNQILLKEETFFKQYKAEDDPEFENWRAWHLNALLEQLYSDREYIFKWITGLSDIEISKAGNHIKYGRLNILQWTEFFLLHEAHHIFTIFQLAHDKELL